MSTPLTHLAWIDLETTGSDETVDEIIEFAMIVTDLNLEVVNTYGYVVQPPPDSDWLHRIKSNNVVWDMHTTNGLIEALLSDEGFSISLVDRVATAMLEDEGIKSHGVMLAGSGVGHFDKRFINRYMPLLTKHLAYPVMDVGVIRRFLRDLVHQEALIPDGGNADNKNHRALDDIKLHLEETRYYTLLMQQAFSGVEFDCDTLMQSAAVTL